jgi:hypothetical protein
MFVSSIHEKVTRNQAIALSSKKITFQSHFGGFQVIAFKKAKKFVAGYPLVISHG